jgi:hypothetical protein
MTKIETLPFQIAIDTLLCLVFLSLPAAYALKSSIKQIIHLLHVRIVKYRYVVPASKPTYLVIQVMFPAV